MLTGSEHENLVWDGNFQYEGLTRLAVPAQGSCLFHTIAKAYFKPYILGEHQGKKLNRTKFIQRLRQDLSKMLGQKINPSDPKSKTYYETLSHGEFVRISKEMPEYSLQSMQEELADSSKPVSDIYNEFISDQLNIDIYILDYEKQDVYMNGGDSNLLYKNRPSVVLLYLPNHYELIGIAKGNSISTNFAPDDPFIQYIKNRMSQLLAD